MTESNDPSDQRVLLKEARDLLDVAMQGAMAQGEKALFYQVYIVLESSSVTATEDRLHRPAARVRLKSYIDANNFQGIAIYSSLEDVAGTRKLVVEAFDTRNGNTAALEWAVKKTLTGKFRPVGERQYKGSAEPL